MHSPQPETRRFPMREAEFIGVMALLQALLALAIDVMLPALDEISTELGVGSPNDRQLVIGIYLIAGGAGSLFPGMFADRFGRKPLVLACLGAYFVFSLACSLASDFEMLLIMRALQGFFTAGLFVLPLAIIRDRFDGDRMARAQSLVAMVFMVVPMLAPTLGQAVLMVAGWREIFGVMALISAMATIWVWLRLPETLHPEFRQPVRPRVILGNMRKAAFHRAAAGYFVGAAFVQGALFGYINSSQQLIAEQLGAGDAFPLVFGGMALIMAGANFTNSRIVERFGARRVSHTALLIYILASLALLIFAGGERATLWHFFPLMTISMCLVGFINANFQAIALQPFGRIAGAAASVQSCLRMVAAAVLGTLIGQAYNGTAAPLAAAMLAAGVFSLLLVLYSERGRLFGRLHYPSGAASE